MLSFKMAGQAGDTIIEVLLAMAVAGMGLAGTYYALNRDSLLTQAQQERAQAIKIVESQIEDLRSHPNDGDAVCFSYQAGAIKPINAAIGAKGSNPCIINADGSEAGAQAQPAYSISITYLAVGGYGVRNYTITTTWDSLTGGTGQVSMEYRNK